MSVTNKADLLLHSSGTYSLAVSKRLKLSSNKISSPIAAHHSSFHTHTAVGATSTFAQKNVLSHDDRHYCIEASNKKQRVNSFVHGDVAAESAQENAK